jgi:hypothetical protein
MNIVENTKKIFDGNKRPKVSSVFTPRAAEVNDEMYIPRPELERSLNRGLDGTLHVIVHGESGAGKSWLYKKVLRQSNTKFEVANCANVARHGSFDEEFKNLLNHRGKAVEVSYKEKKEARINAAVASAGVDHEAHYDLPKPEPLEALLEALFKEGMSILVIDNLEAIMQSPINMQELGNVITLLDDSRYAKYKIKLLIVGVPSDIRSYFRQVANQATVANRLMEIPEVSKLKHEQVEVLVKRGFASLQANVDDNTMTTWVNHIDKVTLGIPQRLHEYCEELAYSCEDADWNCSVDLLEKADEKWLAGGIAQAYTMVEAVLNDRRTTAGRRNQVLYALGEVNSESFSAPEIEKKVREIFSESTLGKTLAVGQILAEIASRENPLIKRTVKGDAYQFTDPRFLMCIRVMLEKSSNGKSVSKKDFGSV